MTRIDHKPELMAALTAVLALTLATGGLLLVLVAGPAGAAFPGENGKILFAGFRTTGAGVDNPEGDQEIFSVNPDGTGLQQITDNSVGDRSPAVSPDRTQIVFTRLSYSQEGRSDIVKMNADSSGKTRLTFDPKIDGSPSFSPDGEKVAFVRQVVEGKRRIYNDEIFTMNADGSRQARLTTSKADGGDPAWWPDGNKIAFSSDGDVYKMKRDGSGETNVTNDATSAYSRDSDPDWQPIPAATANP